MVMEGCKPMFCKKDFSLIHKCLVIVGLSWKIPGTWETFLKDNEMGMENLLIMMDE